MNISKKGTLVSIVILLIIASVGVSIAVSMNESNNVTTENLTIEENQTENQTNLSENLTNILPNMSEKMAKNRSFVNIHTTGQASPESIISYTNPVTGISVFATTFYEDIYDTYYHDWTSYTFYLPTTSYVNVDMSGTIAANLSANAYTVYRLYTDDNQYGSYIDTYGQDSGIYMGISSTEIFYLTKGWHTIYLYGASTPYGDVYTVWGSISIMAFPEYTALTVTSPNGYETWYRGQTKTITWTSKGSPGANVKIELYKAGVKNAVISSKTPNDGSYSWYVPTYQPTGADYKIKITSYEDPTYYDWSNNYFKIY